MLIADLDWLPEDTIVDYVKLERALATLTASLPDQAHWAALTTLEGEIVRYYPTILDGDHIAALTHTIMTQSRHILSELKNGDFRYVITAGTSGFYLTFLLEGTYLLGVNIEQITSLDAIINRIPADLDTLIALANDEDDLP
jgi:predicted regulator of Ras-like GTPase activity (Roadblock/LC7/MglB family)